MVVMPVLMIVAVLMIVLMIVVMLMVLLMVVIMLMVVAVTRHGLVVLLEPVDGHGRVRAGDPVTLARVSFTSTPGRPSSSIFLKKPSRSGASSESAAMSISPAAPMPQSR